MSSDDTSAALQNLSAIKQGKDPRSSKGRPQHDDSNSPDDSLTLVEREVDRLFEEEIDINGIQRNQVTCGVARWDGRNGVCKYNTDLGSKRRFNKRITQTHGAIGNHIVVINEKIFEQGNRDEFIDTIRHEVAHAVCYEQHGSSQGHNATWKAMASKLGADPSSTHHKRDRSDEYEYFISCPNPDCDMKAGKTKRSKTIKKPFNRKCTNCGEVSLASHDAHKPVPTENGTVDVDSIPWSNESEWWEHQS